MNEWNINGKTLEFDEESHSYICDGVLLPSITQILQTKFGHKYDFVDGRTLERAAERGTMIHKAIEDYVKTGLDDDSDEVRGYRFLSDRYRFTALKSEVPVLLYLAGEPVAAGRLDLVIKFVNSVAIADIKTTSTLDKEYLAYQLNLYRIAYQQTYKQTIHELCGIHLRGDKRKLVQIPVNEQRAWELVNEYMGRKETI